MDKIKNNISVAWGSVCADLGKKLPKHAMHAWFDPIVAVEFRDKSFILEVPNQFSLEWIESHYKEEIVSSIKDLFGRDIQYQFIVTKGKKVDIKERNSSGSLNKPKVKRFNILKANYKFVNFIVGGIIDFVKTLSDSVSNIQGKIIFTPLLTIGGVGLEKQHLINAFENIY